MMTYSVGSSDFILCMRNVMSACMLNGKDSTSSSTYKLSAKDTELWLLFVGHKVL